MFIASSQVGPLARGCALLGSGGGGPTAIAEPLLAGVLDERGPVPVVDAGSLPPDAWVACVGAVGSTSVMRERPPAGPEFVRAVRAVERRLGRRLDAVQTLEIGGVNGLLGATAAAWLGLPLLDADAMGRAYPRIDQNALVGRVPAAPLGLSDPSGPVLVLDTAPDHAVERIIRGVLPAMGAWAAVCLHAGPARSYAEHALTGSLTRALALGRGDGPPADATDLFEGTVIEVLRRRDPEGIGGVVSLRHADDPGRSMRLDFANEYVAAFDDGAPVALAPDILALVDARTWAPVGVEQVMAQQRVRLLRIPAPAALREERPGRPSLGLAGYGLAPLAP